MVKHHVSGLASDRVGDFLRLCERNHQEPDFIPDRRTRFACAEDAAASVDLVVDLILAANRFTVDGLNVFGDVVTETAEPAIELLRG